jgi:hypothetical protein
MYRTVVQISCKSCSVSYVPLSLICLPCNFSFEPNSLTSFHPSNGRHSGFPCSKTDHSRPQIEDFHGLGCRAINRRVSLDRLLLQTAIVGRLSLGENLPQDSMKKLQQWASLSNYIMALWCILHWWMIVFLTWAKLCHRTMNSLYHRSLTVVLSYPFTLQHWH